MTSPELARSLVPTQESGDVGCIVIGRNEGERLVRCLRSVVPQARRVVYVDSGSTDGSIERARAFGAQIVSLDPSIPFTAAGARNAGFGALRQSWPDCTFVQFVDGDTELCPGWIASGVAHLRAHPEIAITAGRQRERNPDLTPFHRLFDIEWDTPRGIVKYCSGNALVRVTAYEAAGGFRTDLIAGEEPELCVRIRRNGNLIESIDQPMAVHDAGTLHFSQWWHRCMRTGHAFAEGAHLHGAPPERHYVRESWRIVFWAALLPAATLALAPSTGGLSLLALPAGYAAIAFRVYLHMRARQRSTKDARLAAVLYTLGKFAELCGWLRFHTRRVFGLRRRPIEYKRAGA